MRRKLRVWWRHLWLDQGDARRALGGSAGLDELTRAVQRCEARHAAQVRLCVEASLPWRYLWRGDAPGVRARSMFAKLGVWDTEANNGVLLYVLLADRSVEIVADRAAARAIDEAQWRAITAELAAAFRKGDYAEGTLRAVDRIGELLAKAFPAGDAPADELPNRPALL